MIYANWGGIIALVILFFVWVFTFGESSGAAFNIAILLIIFGSVFRWYAASAKYDREEQKRKEQAAAEAEELQKLKSLCSPHIKCFIAAHRNNTTVWPLNPYLFEIPQETKIAFLAILREQGIAFEYHLEYSILDKLLELEMLEQAQEHFNQSFARLKPKLNADDTIEQWANAYVDVFGNNLDYCNDFLQMAQSKGKDTGHHMLVPIHGEIERRARERHVNELKEVLQSGESVSKKNNYLRCRFNEWY